MLRKLFDIVFTNYYCKKCGGWLGSTDNGDDGDNFSVTCAECG